MSRKKSLQKQLAFQTIHNVSVSKMGQAILKKNPYETRVLTDKLEDIEFHKRKWKNDFCGRVNEAKQEFKQTRSMESLLFAKPHHDSKEGKRFLLHKMAQRLSRKPNLGIYQQQRKTSDNETTSSPEPTWNVGKKDGAIASISGKNKTLTTDIKKFLGDKILRYKENSGRGVVTPHCMTPFIRHSFSVWSDRTATGDVTNWLKCKNCASIVVQEEAETHENGNCDSDTLHVSVSSRHESKIAPKNSKGTAESCLVPTQLPTEKQSHVWRTRTGDIVWKRRVVSGILKREKISNLMNGSSELRARHSLSPVKDARFLGLQSLLVPVTTIRIKKQGQI